MHHFLSNDSGESLQASAIHAQQILRVFQQNTVACNVRKAPGERQNDDASIAPLEFCVWGRIGYSVSRHRPRSTTLPELGVADGRILKTGRTLKTGQFRCGWTVVREYATSKSGTNCHRQWSIHSCPLHFLCSGTTGRF